MSALPRAPGRASDVDLFRYCQGVIDLNAEISDRAFDLGMPEQELDGPEISCPNRPDVLPVLGGVGISVVGSLNPGEP